ncbi:outer membrane beta-barrel protein [Christiangramia sp. 3-2217-3z]|uniref:outer membrane beta-barrel protein n=2 Tax=Christiangramia TaxID=292691 RepID=UPI003EBFB20F
MPGFNYSNSHESNMLNVPLMLKYKIANSGSYLQGGPQASIIFDEERVRHNQDFGVDLGFGLGYDTNEHFFLEATYYHEATNKFKDH